ncbi:MAG TPA: ATP-binding protein, partial [Ignavibacteriaceae bacterium]|nr:ATP-binding protein [Ignavibacteriaceae bacterium]
KDDGKGMNEEDFSFYLRIAGKSRKKDSQQTKAKRNIVGQFGVGFLSALPFCQRYIIETKRKGTDEVVHATISSTEYFKNEFNAIDVDEIPINGSTKSDPNAFADQYTRIRLVGFSKLTKAFFNSAYSVGNKRNTINNYAPMELFKWELCEYLPLNYDDSNPLSKKLNRAFKSGSILPFNVYFNDKPLYRNIHAKNILEISEEEKRIGEIKFTYFILSNYDPIVPTEARYLMLRNLNVGVGARTTFDLGMDGKVYGKLAHLTGEINVTEGLNDLISVSRDKFNFSPDYEKLKEFLRQRLAKWANELDSYKSSEKSLSDLQDEKRVSNLESLKKDKISKEIATLRSKGFNLKKVEDVSGKSIVKLDAAKKEIVLSNDIESFTKSISILGRKYKLVAEKWELDSKFPAIYMEGRTVHVNESYPLFKNSSQFDTFLKIHILWYEYLNDDKISRKAYDEFIADLLNLFNP